MGRNGILDQLAEFDRRADQAPDERYVLRLYITGMAPRSTQAIANIRAFCEEHLPGRYDLEIIDLYQQPESAQDAQVVAAPTLVKELPLPERRLIGDLSDKQRVLAGLDLRRRLPR